MKEHTHSLTFTSDRKPMIITKLSKAERKENFTRYWTRLIDMGTEL